MKMVKLDYEGQSAFPCYPNPIFWEGKLHGADRRAPAGKWEANAISNLSIWNFTKTTQGEIYFIDFIYFIDLYPSQSEVAQGGYK